MSSMLEQAIVDASALKEAAVKNAEQLIIEKYSVDIKEAVNALLEQEEDFGLGGMEGEGETLDDVEAPSAATPGEDACPCPGEEETVTLDLAGLEAALQEMPPTEDEFEDQEDVAQDLAPALSMEEEPLELEEGIEISDELIEELIVDLVPKMNGWAGRPQAELEYEKDKDLARMQSTEYKEENEDLKESLKKAKRENQTLSKERKALGESINKYKEAVVMLKEKVEELSSTSARLLYSNKVLSSASLNERQKQKIVEAISKTDTVQEARVLYETLQGAVGSNPSRRRDPKSLNEAVERRNTVLRARRQESDGSDLPNPVKDRMRKLAGLK